MLVQFRSLSHEEKSAADTASVKGQSVGLHPGTRLTALTRALAIPLGFTSPEYEVVLDNQSMRSV
jgi:hypothetical protein